MTTRKRILATTLALALGATAFSAVVFGGLPNVAGTDEHTSGVRWLLRTTMESSVRARAKTVRVPAELDLDDPQLAQKAYGHYSVACTPCHGAPGLEPAPWMVLNPPATLLTETASDWSSEELFWIIANGIKMTGMPALGPTHADEDLWAITAFVQQLPTMTPARYAEMGERHAAMQHTSAAHGG